jgi:hypothetical protein
MTDHFHQIDKPWGEMTCAEWRAAIRRSARRWAATPEATPIEDATAEDPRVAEILAERDRREAEWPISRIRDLMTEARNSR